MLKQFGSLNLNFHFNSKIISTWKYFPKDFKLFYIIHGSQGVSRWAGRGYPHLHPTVCEHSWFGISALSETQTLCPFLETSSHAGDDKVSNTEESKRSTRLEKDSEGMLL